MRIAFCHNLKTTDSLEEAEYDTQTTVDRLRRALESGGHDVRMVNMNGSVAGIVARLESMRPELIFNTTEGRGGPLREAFFPALFETLKLPFTGGGSRCCALTLDKLATLRGVAAAGVPTPRSLVVAQGSHGISRAELEQLRYPLIAKPNFEGSSIGISSRSVVWDLKELEELLKDLLRDFPDGVLIQEFVPGRDVTVAFLEALTPSILSPTGYTYLNSAENPHNIYDYRLKNEASEKVQVDRDPHLSPETLENIRTWAERSSNALLVRDVGRFDFRVAANGDAYFLEANALPSLEEGAGLLLAAEQRGLGYDEAILAIVQSAARRHGLATGSPKPLRPGLRLGLTFNLKRTDARADDTEAEFDNPGTIAGLKSALEDLGHEVVELEALKDLPIRLTESGVDAVFNIAEGRAGRNREAHVPSLCEFLAIPCTGSDATTLAIALDKSLAKRLLVQAGVPTSRFQLFTTGDEPLDTALRFPLIAKPNAEGTSKGLDERCVVETEPALREVVRRLVNRYLQPVIVEEYVSGREFTVGLVGWPRPTILPPMEVIFLDRDVRHPVYGYELKLDFNPRTRFEYPARVNRRELERLGSVALQAFDTLGCRDVARIDFRLPEDGVPRVIEVNPLPGLSKGFSDLCLVAEGAGMSYESLIHEILKGVLQRRAWSVL